VQPLEHFDGQRTVARLVVRFVDDHDSSEGLTAA